ncbi:MAG: TonB family protein [Gemmatimonadaceae bacterium]|nr:TonB family protein [Gemmatimonadaceae bacterium]
MTTGAAPQRARASQGGPLTTGMLVSAGVHAAVVIGVVMWGLRQAPPRPPVYRVEMIAAPKGKVATGVVDAPSAPRPPKPAEAPRGAETVPTEKAVTTKAVPKATPKATPTNAPSREAGAKAAPTTSKTAAAPAAGSREGGKGADTRNLRLDGIDFPFPGYVKNIIRQLDIAFSPRQVSGALLTEVKFLIRRDGTVIDTEIVKSSRNRIFDLEAMATVEAVGQAKSFGPLPAGWNDDVLVVYFTFDYASRP